MHKGRERAMSKCLLTIIYISLVAWQTYKSMASSWLIDRLPTSDDKGVEKVELVFLRCFLIEIEEILIGCKLEMYI